jgi:hypothetical protein
MRELPIGNRLLDLIDSLLMCPDSSRHIASACGHGNAALTHWACENVSTNAITRAFVDLAVIFTDAALAED